jgi:glycosyltransferase involved in cell wall biosynthesis
MKVGVHLDDLTPTAGGGFSFSEEIKGALIRVPSSHDFFVFSRRASEDTEALATSNVRFVSLKRDVSEKIKSELNKGATKLARILPCIPKALRKPRPPWLQTLAERYEIEFMWFVTPSSTLVDIPFIFTVLDLQHRRQPWFPEVSSNGQWQAREEMYGKALPRAAAVIVGAEAGRDEIVHFYRVPPDRVRLIPHPTPRFAVSPPGETGSAVLAKYSLDKGYLFYPAQFWPHKNHVGLLLALRMLKEKYGLSLTAVLAGSDQGNMEYVREMASKLGIAGQVRFLGFVPVEDLPGLYRNALALVYLSLFGPENLPPLEAFALGCPVIASRVAGAEEQLRDTSLLVDGLNTEEIAQAVKRIHSDEELRRELIEKGLRRGVSWTGEHFVKSVMAILDEFEPVRRCWSPSKPYIWKS